MLELLFATKMWPPTPSHCHLDLISSGKLLPVRRGKERHGHAVPPAPRVRPGPGEQQDCLRLAPVLQHVRNMRGATVCEEPSQRDQQLCEHGF